MITLEQVTAGYRWRPVMTHLDLHIEAGSFTGIVGPTGAGKSTLLKVMLGLVPVSAGRVTVDGADPRRLPAGKVGYVPQHGDLDPYFPITVRQVLRLGLVGNRPRRPWPTRIERRQVAELAERLGLANCLDHPLRDVSGGQRQRALLGRALIAEQRLLVLDEPTAGVDMDTQHTLLQLLVGLNREGLTILVTTHDLNAIALGLPRVVCFNRGVVAHGVPGEVFTSAVLSRTFGENLELVEHGGRRMVAARSPLLP